MLIDTIKYCRKICFHSFEFRCVYDIKYINLENNEEVILAITIGYMKFKSHFYGLSKKIKNARKSSFRFSEVIRVTIKIDSTISNINLCYYIKIPIPILAR